MPIYEYTCENCRRDFEELVRMSTPDEDVACPRCGEHHAKRRLSTFATSGNDRGSGPSQPRRGFT